MENNVVKLFRAKNKELFRAGESIIKPNNDFINDVIMKDVFNCHNLSSSLRFIASSELMLPPTPITGYNLLQASRAIEHLQLDRLLIPGAKIGEICITEHIHDEAHEICDMTIAITLINFYVRRTPKSKLVYEDVVIYVSISTASDLDNNGDSITIGFNEIKEFIDHKPLNDESWSFNNALINDCLSVYNTLGSYPIIKTESKIEQFGNEYKCTTLAYPRQGTTAITVAVSVFHH